MNFKHKHSTNYKKDNLIQYSLDEDGFILHRLDGPASIVVVDNIIIEKYCINGEIIHKDNFEKEVKNYIKKQIFQ